MKDAYLRNLHYTIIDLDFLLRGMGPIVKCKPMTLTGGACQDLN